jgi:hypothetical protein
MRRGTRSPPAWACRSPLGTDAGVGDHGTNAREFRLMVEWGGLAPGAGARRRHRTAARLLGWQDRVGTLAAGATPTWSRSRATRRRT